MIRIAHLLDDFGMGGVTRALSLFEDQEIRDLANSRVIPVASTAKLAPHLSVDIIVNHMTFSWKRMLFYTSLRARNPHCRIVQVEHSYTRAFESLNVRSKARFRAMLKLSAHFVDEVVCVSNAQRDWLAETVGVGREKLTVIHPWTDRRKLLSLSAPEPLKQRPLRLLAYGRYAPVKNFDALISAMCALSPKDVELIMFGDGPERARLERLANGLKHVEVLGPTNSPEDFLAFCDAVVVPSRYEAFGLVATEARMAGRAILVADVDGLPEQAVDAGLVAKMDSADAIAGAINTFAQLDLASLGANGRRSAKQQLDGIIQGWAELIARASRDLECRREDSPDESARIPT